MGAFQDDIRVYISETRRSSVALDRFEGAGLPAPPIIQNQRVTAWLEATPLQSPDNPFASGATAADEF